MDSVMDDLLTKKSGFNSNKQFHEDKFKLILILSFLQHFSTLFFEKKNT